MATVSTAKTPTSIGKDELIHQIAARTGLTLKETAKVIDAFTEAVREHVKQGHAIRLLGFGTWTLSSIAARKVTSIRGGKQITIPAHKRVRFSAGAILARAARPRKRPAQHTHPTRQAATARTASKNGTKR